MLISYILIYMHEKTMCKLSKTENGKKVILALGITGVVIHTIIGSLHIKRSLMMNHDK